MNHRDRRRILALALQCGSAATRVADRSGNIDHLLSRQASQEVGHAVAAMYQAERALEALADTDDE